MSEPTMHLVERVAARLRGEAGLTSTAPLAPAPLAEAPAPAAIAEPAHAEPAHAEADHAEADHAEDGHAEADHTEDGHGGSPPAHDLVQEGAQDGAVFLDMAALKRGGLALAGVRSRVTEEYRITVGRVLRALRNGPRPQPGHAQNSNATAAGTATTHTGNLVMVTSARPGEGKSFSSLNLAASIAQNGLADVVLVDVDAKPRSISTLLGLRDRPGLLDLVERPDLRPEDLLVRTAVDGLQVLPLGTVRAVTADAGVTRALASVIEQIRHRFASQVVLLDTAPCLSTSDPSTLAPMVDQVVMVVEAGRTQRSELGASLELIKACPNIILVLNKVRLTHRHSFGSYYYFGYPS